MWIWPSPQYGTPFVVLVVRLLHGALRDIELDVVLLGDDLGGFVRMLLHELDRLAPSRGSPRG